MQRIFGPFIAGPGAAGLLILRVMIGTGLMLHGWPKIQNPTHWGDQMGIPAVFQLLAACAEFLGGLGLIVGLLTPIAAFGLAINFLVAALWAHADAPVIAKGGGVSKEPALLYLAPSLLLLLAGPGRISLDYRLFGNRSHERKNYG